MTPWRRMFHLIKRSKNDRLFPPAAPAAETAARPASAVLFARHGEVTFQRAYGLEDLDSRQPASADTSFYLCSVAKPITATAVALLAERGRLGFDDPVADYLPEAPPCVRAVTLRQLLLHTAGIPDYWRLAVAAGGDSPQGAERARQILHGITNAGVLELLRAHGALDFPPGTQWRYSNSGYVLLALVVARAAGQPFHAFLRQHLFAPAGMHRTLVYDASHPPVPHLARGYRRGPDGEYVPELARDPDGRFARGGYQTMTMGDGGIFSTVGDLFRFDRALDGERLLSARAQEEMLRRGRLSDGTPLRRPMSPPQALGWRVGEVPRVRLVRLAPPGVRFAVPRVRFARRRMRFASHPGGAGAYRAHFWRFPAARAALIILSADGGLDVDASVVPLLDLLLTGRVPPTAA